MRAAIAECRRRTVAHIPLPAGEAFTLEFVTGRSWSGYNWYQGNYRSLIQVNTDQPVRMGRAIDLGCHEGYPGHHVYNMLLERDLARGPRLGRISWSIRSIRRRASSPKARPITGSSSPFRATSGSPSRRRVLYPLAGLPSDGAATYLRLQEAIKRAERRPLHHRPRPARGPDQPRAGDRADPALR